VDYHRRAPSVAQIEELVDWLSTVHAQKELFATNRLGSVFAPARSYADVASGLLAVSIPKTDRNYILWFRSEVATTVVWARHPGKRLQLEGGVVRLHPRLSFEFWREVVDGVAVPWKKAEIDAVTELRTGILAIDLRRAFQKEQAARALAERIGVEKENMMSHGIRNPLNVIKMRMQMLQMGPAQPRASQLCMLERGIFAVDQVERLVTSVLDLAKLEHAGKVFHYRAESAQELVHDAVDLAAPLAEKAGLKIAATVDADPMMVACQRTGRGGKAQPRDRRRARDQRAHRGGAQVADDGKTAGGLDRSWSGSTCRTRSHDSGRGHLAEQQLTGHHRRQGGDHGLEHRAPPVQAVFQ